MSKEIVIELKTYATYNNKSVELNDLLKELLTENLDYKTIINKAIEYISENKHEMYSDQVKDLLNILRGEE